MSSAEASRPPRGTDGAREWWARVDRVGWRRFFLALLTLALALLMALYATALRESGHYVTGALTALFALGLAGVIAARIVPRLVRRTRLERWRVRIHYELTREGAVYLALIIVIGIAALNTGNNLLFIVLASLLAGILASGVLSRLVLEGLELKLTLPEHLFAERPVEARLTLVNLKRFSPSFSITVSGRVNKNRKGDPDGHIPPRILDQPVYVPYLPHRATVGQRVEIIFPRRGRYTQDGFRVSTKFPFGLLRKSREVLTRQEVIVFPGVEPIQDLLQFFPNLGSHVESPLKGHGHDLYAIRDYRETDAARHVDWKASAKAGNLKVREFTREDERRFTLVFNRLVPNISTLSPAQFENAVRLCACLAWHLYEIGAQMQFLTDNFSAAMSSSAEVIYPALERLALIEPAATNGPPFWAGRDHRLEGFRVIFTGQPRSSIVPGEWGAAQFVFFNELSSMAAKDSA